MTTSPTPTPPLARLLRWEAAGGTWSVVSSGASSASVALCRCDGGEEVERLVSSDAELLAFLAGRSVPESGGREASKSETSREP